MSQVAIGKTKNTLSPLQSVLNHSDTNHHKNKANSKYSKYTYTYTERTELERQNAASGVLLNAKRLIRV